LENIKENYNEVLNKMMTLGVENGDILSHYHLLGKIIERYKETKK